MVYLKGFVFSLLMHCLLHGIGARSTTTNPCYKKENGYKIVNTDNCSQIYVCIFETPFLINCPDATFYNPQLGECNSETSSDACRKSEPSTQTPSRKDNICCGQEVGSILSNPNNKFTYVICQYPLPEIAHCTYNTVFDSQTKTCVKIGQKPECSNLPSNSKWEYKGNCYQYYVCIGELGQAVVDECNNGQLFNPTLQNCVPSNQYDCPW